MMNLKQFGKYVENYQDILPEGAFRISPSKLYGFKVDKPKWYQEQVLGIDEFSGNTYTEIGTIVHRIAERYIKTRGSDVDEIEQYISTLTPSEEVDVDYIQTQWRVMGEALVNHLIVYGIPNRSEEVLSYEFRDGIWIVGTADAVLADSCLIDFKTTSKHSVGDTIPPYYKLQLLVYAWLYRKQGVYIDRVRITWVTHNDVNRISEKTGKPMKDYPTEVIDVTEMVTDEDMKYVEDYLNLVADTYEAIKKSPELAYLIIGDTTLRS